MMTAENGYCVFAYRYRDASNFKVHGEVLLRGSCDQGAFEAIRQRCDWDDAFVAEQVGIPALYHDLYPFSGGSTSDDVAHHEIEGLRPATSSDIRNTPTWGTLDELLERFRSVTSWDCRLSPHCV